MANAVMIWTLLMGQASTISGFVRLNIGVRS